MGISGTPLQYVSIVWVRFFIEPDLFDNNVPFHNTTPIYLIDLLSRSGLDWELHYFSIFHAEWRKRAAYLPRISRKVTSC